MATLGRTTAALSSERFRSRLPTPRPRVQHLRLRKGKSGTRSSGASAVDGSLKASTQTADGTAAADLEAEHTRSAFEGTEEQPEPGKECVDCKRTLHLTEFRRHHWSRDGHQHSCRGCADTKLGMASLPPVTVTSKECSTCGKVKPAGDFSGSRHTKDGLHSWCRDCVSAADQIRTQANAERNRQLVMPSVEEKACTACGEVKPASSFAKRVFSRDGLRSRCKDCISAAERLRRSQLPLAVPPPARACRICGVEKPNSEFNADKRSSDGLRHECKACMRRYQKERRQRKNASRAAAAATSIIAGSN